MRDAMLAYAETVFAENMKRFGFSWSPYSILLSGLEDDRETPKSNWQNHMRRHIPSMAEHPTLYGAKRIINGRHS